MAISRKTQKDVGTYEAKFLGPFTMRQCAILGIGAVPSIFFYAVIYSISKNFYVSILGLIFMLPAAFVAFGKSLCYGLNPEDYFIEWYFYHVKAPNKRVYKTVTVDDKLYDKRIKELKRDKAKQDARRKKLKKKFDEEIIVVPEYGFKKYPHKKDAEIKEYV
mgnify:CR=1 FL=1